MTKISLDDNITVQDVYRIELHVEKQRDRIKKDKIKRDKIKREKD